MRRNLAQWVGCASCVVLAFTAGCGESSDDTASGGASGNGTGPSGGAANHGGTSSVNGGVAGQTSTASGGKSSGGTDGTGNGGNSSAGGNGGSSNSAGSGAEAGEGLGGGTVVGPEGGAGGSTIEGGAGGTVGSGGTAGMSNTVHGKVVDIFGHGVANAPVTIGSTVVATDANGAFTIEDVSAEYDVSAIVSPPIYGGMGVYTWIYQGLTRRDPTLQVLRGVATQNTTIHATISGGSFNDDEKTVLGFGTPDGSGSFEQDYAEVQHLSGFGGWYGPTQTSGHFHALRWKFSDSLPAVYEAYATGLVALSAAGTDQTDLPIDLSPSTVNVATISGSVTSPTTTDRSNYVSVAFTDKATIPLVDGDDGPNTFSYTVPQLTGSKISVAAVAGTYYSYPYALAHKDVDPGTANISLSIPTPPTLVAPVAGVADVTSDTPFVWIGDAKVFLFHVDSPQAYNEGVYIVTSKKQVQIPNLNGSFPLRGNAEPYVWTVEVHNNLQSVDEATAATGFLDSYRYDFEEPEGTRRGDGSFAISTARDLTTH